MHRLLVVVLRNDGHGRGAALDVDVGVRFGGQEEAAVSGERETVAGYFAIAGVGHARFNAIHQVLLLAVNARRHRDLQFAVSVERAALLGLLIAAVGVIILGIGVVALIAFAAGIRLIFIFVVAHRPIGRSVYHPLHLCVRHRLAKVIARVDGCLDRLPLQYARRLRRHLHRVLGLLVILNREAGAFDVALAHLHRQVIRSQLGVRGNCVVPIRRSHFADSGLEGRCRRSKFGRVRCS